MKISLSKRQEDGSRHVVLRIPMKDAVEAHETIRNEVLGRGIRPIRSQRPDGDWIYRFNLRYLDRLMVTFPFAELSAGLHKRMARIAQAEFDAMDEPDIDVPEFIGELYKFQKIGVEHCLQHLDKYGSYMLNDEMGLGKTIQALCVAVLNGGTTLVVTTNSGKRAWAKILNNLFPTVEYTLVEGTPAQRAVKIQNRSPITLVNVEAIRMKKEKRQPPKFSNPHLFNYRYDLLIVDEFHKCKSPSSQQTAGFLALMADKVLMMSGTPILNNPTEFWPAFNKMEPGRFPSFWMFEKNLTIRSKEDNNKIVGYRPEAMMDIRDFLADRSMRRRKEQVGIQMPKVVYSTIDVELTAEQRRLYNRIRDEFKLMLASGEVKKISQARVQVTRLKQACFSPELYGGSSTSAKIEELREIVKELVASGEKAIIFSQWKQATQILRREFAQYNPAYVDGTVKPKDRVKEEDRFNNDPDCMLYIGTISANQEAITLGAATYVIFTDKAWTPLANDQAAARSAAGGLRGVGSEVPVNVIELFATDTFEERIEALLARKKALFNATVERDAGAAVERVTLSDIKSLL